MEIEKTMRLYNLNNVYIKKLFKLRKTDKKAMCKELGITSNTLSLKLTGRTLIYINQAIIIAKYLKMDILDVFCPEKHTMFDALYEDKMNLPDYEYRPFDFNTVYIRNLMKSKDISIESLCGTWNLKNVSIYDKLAGRTKITVQEGLQFADLLNVECNDLYCPSKDMSLQLIAEAFNKEYYKNINGNNLIIRNIKEYKEVLNKFDINNLVQRESDTIRTVVNNKGYQIKDLAEKWGLSLTHTYSKINNKANIDLLQALIMCNWLDEPMGTFFIEG